VYLRRDSSWFCSPAEGPPRRVETTSFGGAIGIGDEYDSATALATSNALGASQRRDAAAQENKRQKLAETRHGQSIAMLAIVSREEHEAVEVRRRHDMSEAAFADVVSFVKTTRVVNILGSTVARTFDGREVSCRSLVLEHLAAPMAAGLKIRQTTGRKRRKGGAPNTKHGLDGFEQLEQIDELFAAKTKLAKDKATSALGRQLTASENLLRDFETKIPAIVAKLVSLGGNVDQLPVASLVLLVRWLQGQHDSDPVFKVKSQYKKTETAPLIAEYRRVRFRATQGSLKTRCQKTR
jgi:hypothetical protein